METSGNNSEPYRNSAGSSNSRRYGMQFSVANFIQAPLSALLEYSGILRPRSSHQETEDLINGDVAAGFGDPIQNRVDDPAAGSSGGEVSIRIIGAGEQENVRVGTNLPPSSVGREGHSGNTGVSTEQIAGPSAATSDRQGDAGTEGGAAEEVSSSSSISAVNSGSGSTNGETVNGVGGNSRDSSYQRYDIQQVARWIEQILPFSLLLLVVFIRQHLQGIFFS